MLQAGVGAHGRDHGLLEAVGAVVGPTEATRNRWRSAACSSSSDWNGGSVSRHVNALNAGGGRVRSTAQAARAASSFFGVSLGLILGQASARLPSSSTRNAERMMPMYLRPYIDFSPQAP